MRIGLIIVVSIFTAGGFSTTEAATGDVVLDLNGATYRIMTASRGDPVLAYRSVVIVQLAVFDAINAFDRRFTPYLLQPEPPVGGAVAAAAVGAGCAVLGALFSAQQSAIEQECGELWSTLPRSEATDRGRGFGEAVGRAHIAARSADDLTVINDYRPYAAPGIYVPTALPVGYTVRQLKPFGLREASQLRPGPPPALDSDQWARDYNESKSLGSRNSTKRTPEQTAIAVFWGFSGAAPFNPLLREAAAMAGLAPVERARLLALAHMAAFDATIAVFDAKYAYNFWRPITAIRNGDIDGNARTERDPNWTPLIETPMHPEYPCAHCIVSAAIGTVLASILGDAPSAPLTATSPVLPGSSRSFSRVSDFAAEVGESRIFGGIHYRTSRDVGASMGRELGRFLVDGYLKPR